MKRMTGPPDNTGDTRQRLLEAAGEIFAEHGLRQATVRDIVERAGVNVAAVNYHFGDKVGLYAAVLQHWLGAAMRKYPPDGGLGADATGPQRLGAFIRSFLFRLLDEGVPTWHGRLMAREMADPTPGIIDVLVKSHIQPHARLLQNIVRDLLGKAAANDIVHLCVFSIVGQCLFYRHCEPSIRLIVPGQNFGHAQVERIADHITRVANAMIASYRDAPPPRRAAASRERA